MRHSFVSGISRGNHEDQPKLPALRHNKDHLPEVTNIQCVIIAHSPYRTVINLSIEDKSKK